MLSNINIHNIKQNASNKFRLYSLLSQNKPLVIVPKCISAINTNNKTIILTFDMPVKSSELSANTAAFTISAPEYDMIPGGMLSTKEYTDISITRQPEFIYKENADLESATLTDTAVSGGILSLSEV